MNNAKINPILPFTPTSSTTSGYYSNSGSGGGNRGNNSDQSFQDIFKKLLERESLKSQNTHMQKLYPAL